MKATVFLRMVVLVTLVFAGVQSKAQDKFVTNEEVTNGLVTSKTIYRDAGTLYRYLKYDYLYDDQSRMLQKEAFKWNYDNSTWMPHYRITYAYSTKEMVMEYASWNKNSKAYDLKKERNVYVLNTNNSPVAYVHFRWDKIKNDWKVFDNMSVDYRNDLYAGTKF